MTHHEFVGISCAELEDRGVRAQQVDLADSEVAALFTRTLMRRPCASAEGMQFGSTQVTRDGILLAVRRLREKIPGDRDG